MKKLNRLKVVLAEQNKSGKWLADKLGKSNCTISKWCNNVVQPDLITLSQIADLFKIDVKELLYSTQEQKEQFAYKLYLKDSKSPKRRELCLYLDEVDNDENAIVEAEAQLNLMSSEGGIPFDERWDILDARLMNGKKLIWEDSLNFNW